MAAGLLSFPLCNNPSSHAQCFPSVLIVHALHNQSADVAEVIHVSGALGYGKIFYNHILRQTLMTCLTEQDCLTSPPNGEP